MEKNTLLKDFYTKEYPTDEEGQTIGNATFKDLFDALDRHKDVYEVIENGDSLIRERLFEKLSEIMGCDYEYIYNRWLEQ